MAAAGGKDYIDARLTRFPCESDVSWAGNSQGSVHESKWSSNWAKPGGSIIGRKDRAYCINYARRIVTKINQYVFGGDIIRNGIDEAFQVDATKTGLSVNCLMQEASASLTAGQWCWLSVDRAVMPRDPATGLPSPRSVAQREAVGDRVFWMLWNSDEIVDWHFDGTGKLKWLITEQAVYNNEDFTVEASTQKVRTIWERGRMTRLILDEKDGSKVASEERVEFAAQAVPFVLMGIPSVKPWWFDDVERVQASLLDLESAHNENLITTVYPQLVLPHGIIEDIMRLTQLDGIEGYQKALELVRGLNYPILEPTEASGLTRYLTPAAGDLKAIPDEIMRRRKELMNIVGLAMANPETNQAQSAKSKAWDNLDPSNTMRTRAIELEDAEAKAVELSKLIDTSFKAYKPEYPRQFDIPEPEQDIATLVQLGNLELPDSGRREVMKASMKLLGAIVSIPKDRMTAVLDEIDKMDIQDLTSLASLLPPIPPDDQA